MKNRLSFIPYEGILLVRKHHRRIYECANSYPTGELYQA
jgi:hypothetical protein